MSRDKSEKLRRHIDNLLVERVINILSFRHSVDSTLHKLQTLRKLWHKHNLFVWKLGIQVMLDSLDLKNDEDDEKRDKNQYSHTVSEKKRRGSNYVRYLIPDNLPEKCTDFIYQVNFEPGEGQNCIQYIRLHRPLKFKVWIKACDY